MGLTTDVERGVLNVPGAAWNLMLFRSTALYAVLPILRGVMPDPMDQQVLAAVLQTEFDYTDPLTYAPRMLESKRILVQESIGDALVPNLATRLLARTMGLSGLDLVEPVFGITEGEGPMASAYTQWDIHAEPLPPTGNTPAEDDNGAHTGIQGLAPLQEQIRLFFQADGQIQSTCDDACDF